MIDKHLGNTSIQFAILDCRNGLGTNLIPRDHPPYVSPVRLHAAPGLPEQLTPICPVLFPATTERPVVLVWPGAMLVDGFRTQRDAFPTF